MLQCFIAHEKGSGWPALQLHDLSHDRVHLQTLINKWHDAAGPQNGLICPAKAMVITFVDLMILLLKTRQMHIFSCQMIGKSKSLLTIARNGHGAH